MKVLIVDDYKTMLRIVRNLLSQIGITDVEDATDGFTALQRLRESRYDFVMCSDKMDPMSSLDLLKEIRADSKLQSIPFIMIMATDNNDKIIAAKTAGVNNYIVKPFNAEELKKKIEAVLGSF